MRGIHVFQCDNCRKTTEVLVRHDEDIPQSCPYCGKHKLTHILAPSNFILKGTGWYATDFKNKQSASKQQNPKS